MPLKFFPVLPIIDSGTNVDRAISSEAVRFTRRSAGPARHTLAFMKPWHYLLLALGAAAIAAPPAAAPGIPRRR